MKKLFCLLLLVSVTCLAQDPYFVNNQRALVQLNPSFAGSNGGARLQMMQRFQRPYTLGAYVTQHISGDMYLPSLEGGVALSYLGDYSDTRTACLNLSYARYMSLGEVTIIPSLQLGLMSRSLDTENLTYGDYTDRRYGQVFTRSTDPNNSNYDLGTGLLVKYKGLYVGTSVMHLNRPEIGYQESVRMPVQFNLHGAFNKQLSNTSALNFSGRFTSQDTKQCGQVLVNGIFMRHLVLGTGYTTALFDIDNGMVLNAGYRNNWTSLLVSYNGSFEEVDGRSYAFWEVALSFNFHKKVLPEGIVDFE